jgi:hypothetical protein
MAKIQISFQDNADNETEFLIYRGANATVTSTDTLIATMTWSTSTSSWSISGAGSNLEITAGLNEAPSSSGSQFIVIYDENTPGNYYYGVAASNAVGASAISSSGLVTVS